ncbi:type I restriction endonuclease subunit R [Prochlorococcus sp. AH-716-P05]|nr:type I restriction endonuclease subunit R [Prochlorococcus sp. AH-716-P05]
MSQPELLYVEQPALDQLQKNGWSYKDGRDLAPDTSDIRLSFKEVVLTLNLEHAIKRLNPWISEDNLRRIIRDITLIQTSTLMEANKWLWEKITQYFSVEQDLGKGRRGQTVKLIDFENIQNNEFLCINQFKVQGPTQKIIPDIILFVNGLPLGVIECKSPYITDPMEAGINQLLRYANLRNPENNEGCQKLFNYNQVMISTHRDGARVGTISSPYEYYLEWKDPFPKEKSELGRNPNSQQILIEGLLKPKQFLDIIQNFTIFEVEDGRTIKKIARYQQFRAVQKTILRLKTTGDRKQKGGVIWHTQGSGKSLTMVFLTQKIRRDPILSDYKLVFLTDRTQLDKQLTNTFRGAQGETVLNAKSVSELKELLRKDSSDLVTSTIQKLEEDDLDFSCLNDSDRIIVLTDEAHRTQYGTLGAAINTALPNAPKIAFTGTPLITGKMKGETVHEFGEFIDQYTIEQAVADGATLQILYEGREAMTKVTGDSLDALFERYFKDKTPEEKNAIKKKYGTVRAVLEAPKRIEWVALDLVEHYREKIMPNGFKVMIVTSSREAAVTYKKKLDEIPDAPDSAVIISGDHNDPPEMMQWTNKTEHQKSIENFKKPLSESSLSILIVKDMLLTGFDAPICQVMYLDRKLTDHSLLQAIARVNRTKAKKFIGYIVDYYGLTDYLKDALEVFSTTDVKGALRNLTDEIPKLEATHTRVIKHFKDIDILDLEKCISLLKDDLKRQQFEIDFRSFSKQMEVVLPNKAASPFVKDLKSLGKIAIGAKNRYRDEQLNILGSGEKVKKLIEDHVFASGIDPRVPPTKLFDESFIKTLGEIEGDEVKASEIEHAIKAHIKLKLEDDPEYYQSLSLRLNEIIENYEDKWDELVRQLLLFRDGLEKEKSQKANDLGLNETEFAFYNILNAEVVKSFGEETFSDEVHERILSLVKKLVNQFEESSKIVGFFLKQDEIKTMQRNIRRAMIEDEFDDPDLRKIVIERFMELARVKFK